MPAIRTTGNAIRAIDRIPVLFLFATLIPLSFSSSPVGEPPIESPPWRVGVGEGVDAPWQALLRTWAHTRGLESFGRSQRASLRDPRGIKNSLSGQFIQVRTSGRRGLWRQGGPRSDEFADTDGELPSENRTGRAVLDHRSSEVVDFVDEREAGSEEGQSGVAVHRADVRRTELFERQFLETPQPRTRFGDVHVERSEHRRPVTGRDAATLHRVAGEECLGRLVEERAVARRVTPGLDDVEVAITERDVVAVAQEQIHRGFRDTHTGEEIARRVVVDDPGIVVPELHPLSTESLDPRS